MSFSNLRATPVLSLGGWRNGSEFSHLPDVGVDPILRRTQARWFSVIIGMSLSSDDTPKVEGSSPLVRNSISYPPR